MGRSRRGEDTLELSKLFVKFATSNKKKFQEALEILSEFGINLEMIPGKGVEIQSNNLRQIAKHCIESIPKLTRRDCVIVEDSGLFIRTLGNFPGPYSSYVYETIGLEGILRLMNKRSDRLAEFRSALASSLPYGRIMVFERSVKGAISRKTRGEHGFGFDPIFCPRTIERTFGEMSSKEKNQISHRAASLRAFARQFITTMRESP